MFSLGANYRDLCEHICVCVCMCLSQSKRRAECVFILQFCINRSYQLDNWSVLTGECVRGSGRAEITHTDAHTRAHTSTFTPSPSTLTLTLRFRVHVCLVGSCPRYLCPLLSPLERGGFEFLAVSVDAWRAGVQLDEELREFVLGEHRFQEALQENVD